MAVTATEVDNDPPDRPKWTILSAARPGMSIPTGRARSNTEAATTIPARSATMRAVGTQPTAIWLDRIAAITAGRGLAGHLDAALAQDAANGAAPVVVTLVLYNLPNRNCPSPG